MAPSRKASLQKTVQAARTPPETPRHARQSSRRSASPANQPTYVRVRDEPPARLTRSWVTAPPVSNTKPTASQRIPIDCPFVGCQASTTHQHLPQLQYYNPRLGRAVHYHGYGNSSRDTSSFRPSLVVTFRTARQGHGGSLEESEANGNDDVVEPEQEIQERGAVAGDDGTAVHEQLAQELENTTKRDETSSGKTDDVQETAAATSHGPAIHDSIHNKSQSNLLQATMTPPASSPFAAEEESIAQPPTRSPEPENSQYPAAPPTPSIQFGDWLPGQRPDPNATSAPPPRTHPSSSSSSSPTQQMAELHRRIQSFQSPPHPSSHHPSPEEQARTDLAAMLGLPDFATFGGIPVIIDDDDATTPLLPHHHLPLSSPDNNDGPAAELLLCEDEECPIVGAHSVGRYLHRGEMPHAFNCDFGYSDPPPEVWCAWARIEELRGGEGEIAMVNGFAKCHWWNGM